MKVNLYISIILGLVGADENLAVVEVDIRRHFKVLWSRTLADTTANVVVRTVARAEPAAVLALTVQRHATQVGANAQKNQVLGVLSARSISLGIAQFYTQLLGPEMNTNNTPLTSQVDLIGRFNLFSSTVTNEQRLATPLDNDSLTLSKSAQIDLQVHYMISLMLDSSCEQCQIVRTI